MFARIGEPPGLEQELPQSTDAPEPVGSLLPKGVLKRILWALCALCGYPLLTFSACTIRGFVVIFNLRPVHHFDEHLRHVLQKRSLSDTFS